MTDPHLHVRASVAGVPLDKAHLPTSPVEVSQLVQFLIRDLGVEPIRSDWQEVLSSTLDTQQ